MKHFDPMDAAKSQLILGHPFWASILLRMRTVPTDRVETVAVNSRTLFYNEQWFQGLGTLDRLMILAGQVEKLARKHNQRRGGRDPESWNTASLKVVLADLAQCGFAVPEHLRSQLNQQFAGKSVEEAYELVHVERSPAGGGGKPQQGQGGQGGQSSGQQSDRSPAGSSGAGQGDPNDPLNQLPQEFVPDLSQGGGTMLEEQADAPGQDGMKIAVAQAMNEAKRRGDLPAHVAREIREVLYPRRSVWDVLNEVMHEQTRTGSDWRRPNPRWVGHGFYMPAKRSEELGDLVIGCDTSGSISQREMDVSAGHVAHIAETYRPRRVIVMHCDAKVHRVQEFRPGDRIVLKPKGGGGTDFRPVFAEVQRRRIEPAALVYLTDLMGRFPSKAPNYPCLWGTATIGAKAPFGRILRL